MTAAARDKPPRWLWLALTGALLLAGCADKRPAPIVDHTGPGALREDERYVVLRGDTLFAIAFRFGLDFRRLAAANAIAAPYTIYPGQVLRLAESEPRAVTSVAKPRIEQPPAKKADSVAVASPAAAKAAPSKSASTSNAKARSRPDSKSRPSAQSSADRSAAPSPVNAPAAGDWRWPAKGRITRRFEADLHKGLDISGDRGDPVLASAAGTVVYAGSGIAGYGLMLIIRHSDAYLSAYGHNDALLADEGENVRAGQQIARRGSSGTDSVKLHFEIRRGGRPVDPLSLLPRR
jgi:lipoprotein NlpD